MNSRGLHILRLLFIAASCTKVMRKPGSWLSIGVCNLFAHLARKYAELVRARSTESKLISYFHITFQV